MTNKIKTTAPVSSVGADGEQPNIKNINEIIANEIAKNNLQATNCPEKSGQGGGLQTVSMTELYDTVSTEKISGFSGTWDSGLVEIVLHPFIWNDTFAMQQFLTLLDLETNK